MRVEQRGRSPNGNMNVKGSDVERHAGPRRLFLTYPMPFNEPTPVTTQTLPSTLPDRGAVFK